MVILDLMLPMIEGLEVCRLLRADPATSGVLVLMLTARSEESDELVGFSVGADDYVTKPFSVKVLLQRINALLSQVEFHSGRYLQLSMRPVPLAALDEFRSTLEAAVAGTIEHDMTRDRQLAEERFVSLRRLMAMISAARTQDDQVSRAILDVRRHVHFHAEEVDAAGVVVHAHESGGPLSGGQNERLTTFCLAAALRYQLAGTGIDVPKYAPIIIDEAFSKGAGKFITAAMESFRHFGFQVILANPGKNPQALAPFIGGVGVVSIRQDRYSSVSPVQFVPVVEE